MNGQTFHLPNCLQKHGCEVDVSRDVNHIGIKPSGFHGNPKAVPNSFTEPTGLTPLNFPISLSKMRQ